MNFIWRRSSRITAVASAGKTRMRLNWSGEMPQRRRRSSVKNCRTVRLRYCPTPGRRMKNKSFFVISPPS